MQSPDTTDAPIVPFVSDATDSTAEKSTADAPQSLASDGGGRPSDRPLDRPPRTDYATAYTRDTQEIEPFVPDLR